jgi:moderate conductance mechanosensitive channel
MRRIFAMHSLAFFFFRYGIFREGRFMGRVLDEWINDAQEFVHRKLPHLVVMIVIAFVLSRLLRLFTARTVHVAEHHEASPARLAQVKTLTGIVQNIGMVIILGFLFLQVLTSIGINLGPLLASAGIAGVAIGLAAQNIVKDVLNGTLILVEDQFNVGNVVTIAGLSGTVEAMTLRKTSVRGGDGTLYVIPNSQITTVANQSAGFSVATIQVSVDFSADPNKVMEILTKTASDVRNDPQFKNLFLSDPQILGVDSMKGSQLIFPVVFKTKAQQQYGPVREFQRRVRIALEENQMLPGDPMRVFQSFSGDVNSSLVAAAVHPGEPTVSRPDPTTLKPHEVNPLTGEGL